MGLEARRWKAFLRLRGETMVEKDEEIPNEFNQFVQTLRQVGVDYSILVNVEGGQTEHLLGRTGRFHSIADTTPTHKKPVRELGG